MWITWLTLYQSPTYSSFLPFLPHSVLPPTFVPARNVRDVLGVRVGLGFANVLMTWLYICPLPLIFPPPPFFLNPTCSSGRLSARPHITAETVGAGVGLGEWNRDEGRG